MYFIRKTCTCCNNVFSTTEIAEARFNQLAEDPEVDISVEGDKEFINRNGCCEACEDQLINED